MKKKSFENEPMTIERLLREAREKNNWNYLEVMEKLDDKNITDKDIKKWEYGLKYPDLDTIYKLSELYQIPSEEIVQAKTNSYTEGLLSVHKYFINFICYILNLSVKTALIIHYLIIYVGYPLLGVIAICAFSLSLQNIRNYTGL